MFCTLDQDKALMDPFLTPLVILGSKYDLFQVGQKFFFFFSLSDMFM